MEQPEFDGKEVSEKPKQWGFYKINVLHTSKPSGARRTKEYSETIHATGDYKES